MKSTVLKTMSVPPDDAQVLLRPGDAKADLCRDCNVLQADYRSDHKSLYQQLLAGLYDAVLVTDPNGYVIDTNPRVEEFFKYSAAETWDMMVGDLITGVNTTLLERVRKGLEQGRFILLDTKCVRKDGSSFAGEVSVSSIQLVNGGDLVFAVRNVDRRKNAWQKLKSSQSAWLTALAAGVISDANGVVCCVNRAGVKLWGCASEDELVGKPFAKLWTDDETVAAALAAVQTGTAWSGILCARTQRGAVPMAVSLEPELDEEGGSAGVLCSALSQKKE